MKILKRLSLLFKSKSVKRLFLIAKGRASNEGSSEGFDRYTGVGIVNVIAVNPTKEELSRIQNREVTVDPVYVYPQETKEDVNMVRIVFYVKTTDHDENMGVDVTSQLSFILRDSYLTSNKSEVEKVKVIDGYGQTGWVNEEELKNQTVPMNKNGKRARLIAPFRPMYQGEEELVDFLKKFLNVPDAMDYNRDSGEWVVSKDIDIAEISLSNIKEYFKGNVKEIRDAINAWDQNLVKVLFYVRTNDDNKSYQSVLSDLVLRPGSRNYEPFLKKVKERQEFGAYANATFTYGPLEVLSLTPTSFSQKTESTDDVKSKWF